MDILRKLILPEIDRGLALQAVTPGHTAWIGCRRISTYKHIQDWQNVGGGVGKGEEGDSVETSNSCSFQKCRMCRAPVLHVGLLWLLPPEADRCSFFFFFFPVQRM